MITVINMNDRFFFSLGMGILTRGGFLRSGYLLDAFVASWPPCNKGLMIITKLEKTEAARQEIKGEREVRIDDRDHLDKTARRDRPSSDN